MSSSKSAECPRAASGIALLRHPYDQVAAAFEDGVSCPANGERRGGFVRPQKRPRLMPWESPTAWKVTHVESSFNEPQQAYVGLCVAGLNKLARGKVLGANNAAPLSLSERVRSYFLGDAALRFQFGKALVRSTANVFEEFGALYPNLTPALNAMYCGGAIVEGAALAVADAHAAYIKMLSGTPPNMQRLGSDATTLFFTARPVTKSTTSHEVWCPGEAFAKTMLRQGIQAATELSQTPEIAENAIENTFAENAAMSMQEMRTTISAGIEHAIIHAEPASPDVW